MDPRMMKQPPEDPAEEAQDQPGAPEGSPQDVEEPAAEASQDTGAQPEGAGDQDGIVNAGTGDKKFDEGDGDEKPNVTPEEQAMYDATMTAALNWMYDPGRFQALLRKLAMGRDNISKEIGHTAYVCMKTIQLSVQKQNKDVPADVLYAAAQEVVSDLCTIAVGAKIMKQDLFKTVYEAAVFEGLRLWGIDMKNEGKISPELQAQSQQELAARGIKQTPPPAPPQQQPDAEQPAPPQQGIVNQATGA